MRDHVVVWRRQTVLAVGDFCFRWRSYLPLLLLPLIIAAIARARYPFGTHAADLAWESSCVLLALGGLALRVWTVGGAAPGTSGRATRRPKAASLNTTGPYSVMRHPLYVANGLIALGLTLFPHGWLAPSVVAGLALVYYACIAQREEQYLRERFGAAFEEWAARVPAAVPVLCRYVPAPRPFAWRVVVSREFYALTLILTVPLLLDIVEDFDDTGGIVFDPLWLSTAMLGVTVFLVLRFLKKHTSVLSSHPEA